MKIVIIDNYDSFTYNLSHLVKELGAEVTVLRNDQFELQDLEPYSKIILSPGPGDKRILLKDSSCESSNWSFLKTVTSAPSSFTKCARL